MSLSSRVKVYLKKGTAYKGYEDSSGGFDLLRWLQNGLNQLNVSNVDPCCTASQTTYPVRWNATTGHLEYFGTNGWTQVPHV